LAPAGLFPDFQACGQQVSYGFGASGELPEFPGLQRKLAVRQRCVLGNWKMNGSRTEVAALCEALREGLADSTDGVLVGVMPTALHLDLVQQRLGDSVIQLGVQNFYPRTSGAYTGEVSLPMAAEFGVSLALVGHSERRELFAESDELIAAKFSAACALGVRPVLCVGEMLADREAGRTEEVVLGQLNAVLDSADLVSLQSAIIAYEPVWAIGTGVTASPEQAQAVHRIIRQRLADVDTSLAEQLPLLYGGSVKSANASELFAQEDIDGGLVGGASLDAAEFVAICRAVFPE
jgi:triosephosphate isomerase